MTKWIVLYFLLVIVSTALAIGALLHAENKDGHLVIIPTGDGTMVPVWEDGK